MKNGNKNEWLRENAWSLLIALVTLTSTYAIYGYRILENEKDVAELKGKVEVVNELSSQAAKIEERTENIQKDVAEMKADIKALIKVIE